MLSGNTIEVSIKVRHQYLGLIEVKQQLNRKFAFIRFGQVNPIYINKFDGVLYHCTNEQSLQQIQLTPKQLLWRYERRLPS